jgi:hypothetical protein
MYERIAPGNVSGIWPWVAPWIAQAIGASDTWSDLESIKDKAQQGYAHIWIGRDQSDRIDVVFVTETWYMDGRKALVIRWLAGKEMDNWLGDLEWIENYAVNDGYHVVHIWGRPGWQKVCKPLGYKHEFTVISKPLIRGMN